MKWLAYLGNASSVSSNVLTLGELLARYMREITAFYWCDKSGMRLGCKIPPDCEIIVFKRNYISTEGVKDTVFVLGWKSVTGVETLAFLQPSGLVEMSGDREYLTTLERIAIEGS